MVLGYAMRLTATGLGLGIIGAKAIPGFPPAHVPLWAITIGFGFAALDYAAPDRNRFMYRLDGLDEDWVDAGNQRQVTYMNIPAGEYTFRVRASNYAGVWSTQDATTGISVRPAPWRTWWAYTVYALARLGIVFAAYLTNTRRTEHAARLHYLDDLELLQSRLSDTQRISRPGNSDWNIATNQF